jgi:hypothetical protein
VATYDVALRAEYRTGHYKDPMQHFAKQTNAGFDAVEVPAGLYFRVEIEAGQAGVWVNKDATDYVRLRQTGRTLAITLTKPEEEHFLSGRPHIIIHCPQLSQLTTDLPYPVARRKNHNGPGGEIEVRNFNQDSLRIDQRWAGNVKLAGNTLHQLRAVAGTGVGSNAELDIAGNNRIQAADLAINHQSKLTLRTAIPQLRTQFSDSAVVTFGGAAAAALAKK